MKIIFTTKDRGKLSEMDMRFGRCAYFALYDTESKGIDFIENNGIDQSQGAGINAAQKAIEIGASAVVTGRLGPKAKQVLMQANIQGYEAKEESLENTINYYIDNQLKKMD